MVPIVVVRKKKNFIRIKWYLYTRQLLFFFVHQSWQSSFELNTMRKLIIFQVADLYADG